MAIRIRIKSIVSVFLSTLFGVFLLAGFSQNIFAAGIFINAPNRVDMVYDNARNLLYITSGNSVLRYSLATNSFLQPYELSGALEGIDISKDNNTLAVADHNLFGIYLIDLTTGQSKIALYNPNNERGTYAVAFSGNNTLLVTASFDGSGFVPLRKYDITSNTFTILNNSISQDTMVSASADGSVIGLAESNSSDGPFGRYRVADGDLQLLAFDKGTQWFNYEIGVSHNGTQYSIPTYGGTFLTDSNLIKFALIGSYATGQPVGVAYDPTKDVVYYPWAGTSEVYAYDTTTLQQIANYDVQGTFGPNGNYAYQSGRSKISRDGKYLFVSVDNGISYINLSAPDKKFPRSNRTTPDQNVHLLKVK